MKVLISVLFLITGLIAQAEEINPASTMGKISLNKMFTSLETVVEDRNQLMSAFIINIPSSVNGAKVVEARVAEGQVLESENCRIELTGTNAGFNGANQLKIMAWNVSKTKDLSKQELIACFREIARSKSSEGKLLIDLEVGLESESFDEVKSNNSRVKESIRVFENS